MFSLTSFNATPTQQLNPSGRFSRRATRSVKIIAAAAVALLFTANTFASADENPTRMAREHHACLHHGAPSTGRPLRYMHQKPREDLV